MEGLRKRRKGLGRKGRRKEGIGKGGRATKK